MRVHPPDRSRVPGRREPERGRDVVHRVEREPRRDADRAEHSAQHEEHLRRAPAVDLPQTEPHPRRRIFAFHKRRRGIRHAPTIIRPMRIALAATLLVATGCSGFHKGMTWQITLSEPPRSRNVDVEAWDLDLFDTPSDVIRTIHDGGTQVICYFSSGTFEPFRSDANTFDP